MLKNRNYSLDKATRRNTSIISKYSTLFLNIYKDGSNNVAEDGNFSIQVLTEALKKTANLIVQSVDAKINQGQDLSNETGFICNSAAHWFTIRKVD